jgi:GTP-binding protein HflX
VLEELGADGKPTVIALNKTDQWSPEAGQSPATVAASLDLPADTIAISGLSGDGVPNLLARVQHELDALQHLVPVSLTVPYNRTDLVDQFHQAGRVISTDYTEEGTTLTGWLPESAAGRFSPHLTLRDLPVDGMPVDTWATNPNAVPGSAA